MRHRAPIRTGRGGAHSYVGPRHPLVVEAGRCGCAIIECEDGCDPRDICKVLDVPYERTLCPVHLAQYEADGKPVEWSETDRPRAGRDQ